MHRILSTVLALCAVLFALPACAAGGYSDWAALVVAGDWHSHSGNASQVFDNGRRDIAAALARMGFAPNNIVQFTVGPEHINPAGWRRADRQAIANDLWDLSNRTSAGCFAYFSSHGSPDGILIDDGPLSPANMAGMIDNACGSRPTVVFVSSCFSGVFLDALSAPNRFVMTAARPDRTSFGCGDNDRYTFFDNCFLDSVNGSGDFPALANTIRACVSRKEAEIHAFPSEPQLSIGASVTAQLPRLH